MTERTGARGRWEDAGPADAGAGPSFGSCLLLPGYAQWSWGQGERGMVLLGSFAIAAVMAAFTWGTGAGAALLLFAYATHVFSAADALRQRSFPVPSHAAACLGSAVALGFAVYLPVLAVAASLAWPGTNAGSGSERYLVNRWAYRESEPKSDEWVWYRPASDAEPRIGRVVAGAGQEVHWSGKALEVDGKPMLGLNNPVRSSRPPTEVRYTVPLKYVLIAPEAVRPGHQPPEGLILIPHGGVEGRAWARMYPIRERRLLFSGGRAGRGGDS